MRQFAEVVGKPALPPYWALGYHQSGYHQSSESLLTDVLAHIVDDGVPCDSVSGQWLRVRFARG